MDRSSPAAATTRRRAAGAWLVHAAAAIPPLVIYWRTMAPGLTLHGDSPKFQYLGAVLGTGHAPGYPLYIGLSWLASQIPAGTVAWRVNLLTMLLGVAAAVLTAWAARAAGAGRAASVLAGLGLAFGPVVWAQATSAEVYTLATALVAAEFALVLRWRETRRPAHLVGAIAVAALALGHHPTTALAAPALVVFVLATDRRAATRPRILLGGAALLAAGLAQYAYIIARTRQGAAYLEATARTAGELWPVLTGRQFGARLFAFTPGEILTDRLPAAAAIVAAEVPAVALVLAALGLAWLAARRDTAAILAVLAGATWLAFAAATDVPDVHVFLIPIFFVLWVLAAVGLAAAISSLPARPGARPVMAAAVAAGIAATLVARGYAGHDRSDDTYPAEYFAALARDLRQPADVLADDMYAPGQAVRYMLAAGGAAGADIRVTDSVALPDPAAGLAGPRAIYAFEPARARLEAAGVLAARVVLEARLAGRLDNLPRGAAVAVALAPGATAALDADDLAFLRRLDLGRLRAQAAAAAVVAGGRPVALQSSTPAAAGLDVAGAGALRADASPAGVAIALGDTVLAAHDAGVAVAAVARDGRVLWADVIDRASGRRPVVDMGRLPLFRAAAPAPCRRIDAGAWTRFAGGDLPGTRLAFAAEPGASASRLILYTAHAGAGAAGPRGHALDGRPLDITSAAFDPAAPGSRAALDAALARDGLAFHDAAATVVRSEVEIPGGDPAGGIVAWPSAPAAIAAGLAGRGGAPVRACGGAVQGFVPFADPSDWQLDLMRAGAEVLGPGWHGVESGPGDRLRWTSAARAESRFTLLAPLPLTVTLEAEPAPALVDGDVRVVVNGSALDPRRIGPGRREYRWTIPAGLLRAGYNTVAIDTPAPVAPATAGTGTDPRPLGLAVRAFELRRAGPMR